MSEPISRSKAFFGRCEPVAKTLGANAASVAVEDGTELAVIDTDAFNELLLVCDVDTTPEFLCEILEDFLTDTVVQLDLLRQAVSTENAQMMDQAAHALKASSSNVAAMRMSELCFMLQRMGRSGHLQGALEHIELLEHEFAKVRNVFVNECQRRRDAFAAGH